MEDYPTVAVRAHRRYGSSRVCGLCLVVLTIVGLSAIPAAAAQADDTWLGTSTTSAWSAPANWTAGVPHTAAGVLTFPTLTNCASPSTCYTSHNDLTGIAATGLAFSNTVGAYHISGNSLAVGAGGIRINPGGRSAVINLPLNLTAAQTWTIGGGSGSGYNSLSLVGGIGGSGSVLNVAFPATGYGDLYVDSNMEVGSVTVSGVGGLHVGGCPTCNTPGSVNGTDRNTVLIRSGASLVANPSSTVGPLAITGGKLLLGTNRTNTGTTTLGVNGAFSIDSASTTTTFINANGPTPGTDFSQLNASGNIALAGALKIGQGASATGCVALSKGDVATLFVTSGGTLSGKFANAAEGAIITLSPSCSSTAHKVQIHYASNTVIATVVS